MNDNREIFNLTIDQIEKLSGTRNDKCDYNTPIRKGETLEPCLRGAKKVMADEKKREMMYRIYRGIKTNGEKMD